MSKVQTSYIYLHIYVGPLSRPCFWARWKTRARTLFVCGALPAGQVIIAINKIIQTCNTIFLVYIYFNFINMVCFELISCLSGSGYNPSQSLVSLRSGLRHGERLCMILTWAKNIIDNVSLISKLISFCNYLPLRVSYFRLTLPKDGCQSDSKVRTSQHCANNCWWRQSVLPYMLVILLLTPS